MDLRQPLRHSCPQATFKQRQQQCEESYSKGTPCDINCRARHTVWSRVFHAEPYEDNLHETAKRVKELHRFASEMQSVMGKDGEGMLENTLLYREELQAHLHHEFFSCADRGVSAPQS